MNPRAGRLISFEGIEGSGKSTQIRPLEDWLRNQGRRVLAVREPGGTELSEEIRDLLLRRDGPPVPAWSELCLYLAARAQLVGEVIRPALEQGLIVIADRYGDASVAYQGAGRRLGVDRVRRMNGWVTGDLVPDLTLLLDLDPGEGLARIRRARGTDALDRLEREPLAFHRRIRAAYLRLAKREPDRFRVLDGTLPAETLAESIRAEVSKLL